MEKSIKNSFVSFIAQIVFCVLLVAIIILGTTSIFGVKTSNINLFGVTVICFMQFISILYRAFYLWGEVEQCYEYDEKVAKTLIRVMKNEKAIILEKTADYEIYRLKYTKYFAPMQLRIRYRESKAYLSAPRELAWEFDTVLSKQC